MLIFNDQESYLQSTLNIILYFGLPTFVFHEVFWFFLNFPYLLIERFGWFQQYKIQQKVKNNYEEMRKMFIQMMFEHLTIILPACLVVSAVPITRSIVIMDWSALPSFFEALLQGLTARALQELIFYAFHRYLHTPDAYKSIHKVHHEHTAPFALSSEHAHPIEGAIGFTGPFVVSVLLIGLVKPFHLITLYVALYHTLVRSVEGHSGYNLPWQLDNIPPFGWNGGSLWHDWHHQNFNGNYGEKWIDYLFGTDASSMKKKSTEKKQS